MPARQCSADRSRDRNCRQSQTDTASPRPIETFALSIEAGRRAARDRAAPGKRSDRIRCAPPADPKSQDYRVRLTALDNRVVGPASARGGERGWLEMRTWWARHID